jgi:flagellar protein FlaI
MRDFLGARFKGARWGGARRVFIRAARAPGMARVTKGYPFSSYEVVEEEITPESDKIAVALGDFLQRRISAETFCERAIINPARSKNALELLATRTDVTRIGRPIPYAEKQALLKAIVSILKERPDGEVIARSTVRRLHGYRLVEPLFEDTDLEEIIINGSWEPVYVYHRAAGICKTNLQFKDDKHLRTFIDQFGRGEPGISQDVKLGDGSRANVIYPPVVPEPVITIRKFRAQPWSIIDIIQSGTMSSELAAFLWVCTDGLRLFPLNMLVSGGTASGKTSTLNALSTFLPPEERVLTIEEVLELNLFGRDDWVALEASTVAPLDDLLKNALRMRPDRIIVGEVRGKEALTMFTAMNVGHRGSMGTLHANSDRDLVLRLENAPMSVPRQMIPLVDLIIVQHRVQERRKGLLRRVTQVSEVSRVEDLIALNEIYKWNPQTDSIERTELPSQSTEKIARALGVPIPQVMEEIKRRKGILDYLIDKGVHVQEEVSEFMRQFYAQEAGFTQASEK